MAENRVYKMTFSSIYPLYLQKVERKSRSKSELDEVLRWLTGYSQEALEVEARGDTTLQEFFENAPRINPNTDKITGVICGYRVEEITDPLMQKIRWMDKLVDELAKGRSIEKILRS